MPNVQQIKTSVRGYNRLASPPQLLAAMGKLLKLRQGVLAAGGDQKRLVELLAASLSTIMVIFRAVIRLHGGVPAKDNLAVSQALAAYTRVDAAPFERVVRHVRGDQAITPADAGAVMAGYLGGMEALVAHLDRFGR